MRYAKLWTCLIAGTIIAVYVALPVHSAEMTEAPGWIEILEVVMLATSFVGWTSLIIRDLRDDRLTGTTSIFFPVFLSLLTAAAIELELFDWMGGRLAQLGLTVLVACTIGLWAILVGKWWTAGAKRWDLVAEILSSPTTPYVGAGIVLIAMSTTFNSLLAKEIFEIAGLASLLFAAILANMPQVSNAGGK